MPGIHGFHSDHLLLCCIEIATIDQRLHTVLCRDTGHVCIVTIGLFSLKEQQLSRPKRTTMKRQFQCLAKQHGTAYCRRWPVARICVTVGLTSVGSFTSSFSRMFGSTPTAYRAAYPPATSLARVPACVLRVYGRPVIRTSREVRTFREDAASG